MKDLKVTVRLKNDSAIPDNVPGSPENAVGTGTFVQPSAILSGSGGGGIPKEKTPDISILKPSLDLSILLGDVTFRLWADLQLDPRVQRERMTVDWVGGGGGRGRRRGGRRGGRGREGKEEEEELERKTQRR